MKILFSPSEAKSHFTDSPSLNIKSLCFANKFSQRLFVIDKLSKFLSASSLTKQQKLFGIKNEKECMKLKDINLLQNHTCKAIQRYTGVAYQYLNFDTLKDNEKKWLYENTLIFSNLFGPLLASDLIPYYKFKQAESIDDFKPELFYKENFSSEIDNYIDNDIIIDLRAGFYEKFYKINSSYITMKFIKNGKVVSHWAKAYRGKVLRKLSQVQPNTIEEFENINFEGLHVEEILVKKLKREYIFKINV